MSASQHAKVLEALEALINDPGDDHIKSSTWDKAREALSIMRAVQVGEPQGWKLIGWTCENGGCGRIHDEPDDGYRQAVYVMADLPAPPTEPEVKP